jgi:hypothetical protein
MQKAGKGQELSMRRKGINYMALLQFFEYLNFLQFNTYSKSSIK